MAISDTRVTKSENHHAPGLKLLLICGLILLMSIPALFVYFVVYDRSSRADKTRDQIAQAAGGAQRLIGPVLAIPVETLDKQGRWVVTDIAFIFAENGSASSSFDVTTRHKSLYAMQVYTGKIDFQAHFDLSMLKAIGDEDTRLLTKQGRILLGLSDRRGALGDAWLDIEGAQSVRFETYVRGFSIYRKIAGGEFNKMPGILNFFSVNRSQSNILSVPVGQVLSANTLDIKVRMPLGGARQVEFIPFARSTSIDITSNWPDPGFGGDYLPSEKSITAQGFTASRTIPALASSIPPFAYNSDLSNWTKNHHGFLVKFVDTASPYQYVSRSLKYALMFIGFVFLTFFLFETADARPVHAAQYVLIGIAQSVFYLLLLAFSERIGFDAAFILAALATVLLLGIYAGSVFGKRRGLAALAIFGTVYALMFLLMRIEDFALMVGAIASFAAIAITMWMTRKVDWYGAFQQADNVTTD